MLHRGSARTCYHREMMVDRACVDDQWPARRGSDVEDQRRVIIPRMAGPIRISALSTLRRVALLVILGSGAVTTAQLIGETASTVRFRSEGVFRDDPRGNHHLLLPG